MPFENHGTRTFTVASIEKNAPSASGLYGLSNARKWIYVGECDNVKAKLLELLRETDTSLAAQRPTGFTYELCASGGRIGRQNQLVLELEPVCNRMSGDLLRQAGSAASRI
jgi:hypothetical protein